MRRLFILGTAGQAREIGMLAHVVNALAPRWVSVEFISETSAEVGRDLGYGSVSGDDRWLLSQSMQVDIVVGIGFPHVRRRALRRYIERPDMFEFPNIIHPSVTMDPDHLRVGRGNVITAGCSLTCDITIGDFNLVNPHATIGHDAVLGNYNVVNPSANISGYVMMGDRVLVGTGAQILQHVSIADDATVGAGAVVRADVLSGQTVVGVPAKPLQR